METANAQLDTSVENFDDAVVTLLADVATNYVQYRVAQQRIKIARANLRAQEALVAVAERQRKVGTGTALDVEQLRTLAEQTRSSVPALQITQGQANDRLCVLVGEPPHDLEPELGPGPALGALPTPKVPSSVAAGVPSDLLLRRPDVRSAERQLAAQVPQIGVAEADLYPSISIGTIIGQADLSVIPNMATSGPLALVTPQFRWSILNYGRLVNNVQRQRARALELIASYQNKVLSAAQEVQTNLRAFLRSQEQTEALQRGATAAVAATAIEEQLFTQVKADVNRLFTLENSQLQVQDQLAVAQGNIALNLINVYRALGGGWEVRTIKDLCAKVPPTMPVEPAGAQAEPALEALPAPRPGTGRD